MHSKPGRLPVSKVEKHLVSLQDLAKYYKVSRSTIEVAHRREEIPGAFQVLGRLMFDLTEAQNWVPHESSAKQPAIALRKWFVFGAFRAQRLAFVPTER